jgi:hypothetical protein
MSGPVRELPPLRVKLIGDGSSYEKMLQDAMKNTRDLEKQIGKWGSSSASGTRKAMQTAMKNMLSQMSTAIAKSINSATSQMSRAAVNVRQTRTALRAAVRTAASAIVSAAVASVNAASAGMAGRPVAVGHARRLMNQAVLAGVRNVAAAIQNSITAAGQNMRSRGGRVTGGGGRSAGGGGSGSGGGGMGLGNRADIYMHRDALRGLAAAWKGPLDRLKDYQTRLASMSTFMGGKGQAETFMGGLEQSQVGQMYGQEAALGAQRFQPHTKDANETMEILKTIGDLAFGDEQRFHGLSRALSQVMSQKYLQGDENEQFAENEIALHQMIADAYGLTTAEVMELQGQRRISSEMVLAVLKNETAQGGKYAGQLNNIAGGLKGAQVRAEALYAILERDILKTVDADIAKMIKTLSSYIVLATEWVKNNQALVTQLAQIAIKVTAAAAGFHILGMVVALVSWNISQLAKLTIFLTLAKRILIGTLVLLRGVFAILRMSVMAVIGAYRLWLTIVLATRTAMIAFAAGMAFVRSAVIAYTATSYACVVAMALMNLAFRSSGMAGIFFSKVVQVASGAVRGLAMVLRVLRIGAVLTWLAMYAPIPMIIGGVALIIYIVYQLVAALMGVSISFSQVMEYAKAAALAIAGFFYNIGHNAQVIAKYVYDNFWNLMTDLGSVFVAGFKMLPIIMSTAFVTGMRIMAAFIGWLSEALPKAMTAAGKLMWNGLSWFFTTAYNAGSELWKYLTSGKAAEDVASFGGVVVKDLLNVENKGLGQQLADITAEEFGKMSSQTSGIMEGMKFKSPEMTGLKYDLPPDIMDSIGIPDLGPIPDINELPAIPDALPEIPTAGMGAGMGAGDNVEVAETLRQNSSESAKFQHSLRVKAMASAENIADEDYKKEMVEQAKKQAILLEAIKNGIINKPLTSLNVSGIA